MTGLLRQFGWLGILEAVEKGERIEGLYLHVRKGPADGRRPGRGQSGGCRWF